MKSKKTNAVSHSNSILHKIKINTYLFIIAIIVILVCIIVKVTTPSCKNVINNEKNDIFPTQWQYSIDNGEKIPVILPYNEHHPVNSHITLTNSLPIEMVKGATLLVFTTQQDIEVYIENELIYTCYNGDKSNHVASSTYHFIRLPNDSATKNISIILSSPYKRYIGIMEQIHIGSKASNIFFLLEQHGLLFIISFLIFCLGLFLIIIFSFVKERVIRLPSIYLGAFFVCSGFWFIVQSRMAQFFIPYPATLTNIGLFALTLMPAFAGLYYYTTKPTGNLLFLKIVIALSTIGSNMLAIFMTIKPILVNHFIPYYIAYMGICFTLLFIIVIIKSKQAKKMFTPPVIGVIVFGVFGLLELIIYFINHQHYNSSYFLIIGVLLFCIIMVADIIKKFTQLYKTSVQVNALKVLAYTDSLTGLDNRTAFLNKMTAIDINNENQITIGMFDLNNLKQVNDTFGHLVGDSMLILSVKTIKSCLQQMGELYRIGGDEFVCIIFHNSSFDIENIRQMLDISIINENKKALDYFLSIAYGFATFSKNIDKTLFDTLSRADENMYNCKKLQKNIQKGGN